MVAFFSKKSHGVRRKYEGYRHALSHGNEVELITNEKMTINQYFIILNKLINQQFDWFVYRHTGWNNILIIPILLVCKLRGVKITSEIPTPIHVGFLEMWNNDAKSKSLIYYLFNLFSMPLVNALSNNILTYSVDSKIFSLLSGGKNRLIGNGVNYKKVDFPFQDNVNVNSLNIIAVGHLASWHGFDRIINSISDFKAKNSNIIINLNIVGDGPDLKRLINLTERLSASDFIKFHGEKTGKELEDMYLNSDMAVSSLAGFRKSLFISSEIKSREYCLYGLPFVLASKDPDFYNCDFVINVENSDSEIRFEDILSEYINIRSNGFGKESIHSYAKEKLTFEAKKKEIISESR